MTFFHSTRRMRVPTVCLLAGLTAANFAFADSSSDTGWIGARTKSVETPVVLPSAPSDLLKVHITAGGTLQFFVDRASISVQPGQIVRYTLVAKTPDGPSNVSYESINCALRQWKLHAIWDASSKRWSTAVGNDWQRIPENGATRVHSTLFNDDFCRDRVVNGTPAEMAQRIEQGLRALPD